jgi:hypothetical protein
MNEFEAIIKKERETSYSLENKDLFTLYTLTLINQEESRRRHKRNLIFYGLIVVILALYFLPFMEFFINSYIDLFMRKFMPLVYNPVITYLFSFLLTGFVILNKKTSNF